MHLLTSLGLQPPAAKGGKGCCDSSLCPLWNPLLPFNAICFPLSREDRGFLLDCCAQDRVALPTGQPGASLSATSIVALVAAGRITHPCTQFPKGQLPFAYFLPGAAFARKSVCHPERSDRRERSRRIWPQPVTRSFDSASLHSG